MRASAGRTGCECVALSALATRTSEWLAGLVAGCDRLVHSSVSSDNQRAVHGRLLRILLAGPFLLACAALQVLVPALGVATTLAIVCVSLAVAWLALLMVAATGRAGVAASAMLAACVPFAGLVIAAAGGLASPLALLAGGLVLEAYWIGRTARAALAGAAAALAALVAQALISPWLPDAQAVSPWHWLVPAAYAALVAPRLRELLGVGASSVHEDERETLVQAIDAVVLRMGANGDVADVSEKARVLLNLQPELLLSSGLLDRIHVADRVAYLSALADLREGLAT